MEKQAWINESWRSGCLNGEHPRWRTHFHKAKQTVRPARHSSTVPPVGSQTHQNRGEAFASIHEWLLCHDHSPQQIRGDVTEEIPFTSCMIRNKLRVEEIDEMKVLMGLHVRPAPVVLFIWKVFGLHVWILDPTTEEFYNTEHI